MQKTDIEPLLANSLAGGVNLLMSAVDSDGLDGRISEIDFYHYFYRRHAI